MTQPSLHAVQNCEELKKNQIMKISWLSGSKNFGGKRHQLVFITLLRDLVQC